MICDDIKDILYIYKDKNLSLLPFVKPFTVRYANDSRLTVYIFWHILWIIMAEYNENLEKVIFPPPFLVL